jgi:tetratricopeptide (TPR) repeat protein
MKELNYPELSKIFDSDVHRKYFDSGADPEDGIILVDRFLAKYPYYPEALLFKSRMFIVKGYYEDALSYLDVVARIDKWRAVYLFDKAEVLYNIGQRQEAIVAIVHAIQSLLGETLDGIDNFLLSIQDCTTNTRIATKRYIINEMIGVLSSKSNSLVLDNILSLIDGKEE